MSNPMSRNQRQSPAREQLESPRVLVADKDLGVRETVLELLEDQGMRCVGAGNGDEAVLALRHQTFEAMVADLILYEARRRALEDLLLARQPPIGVLLTHTGQAKDHLFPVIQKPFQRATLLRALARVLVPLR